MGGVFGSPSSIKSKSLTTLPGHADYLEKEKEAKTTLQQML